MTAPHSHTSLPTKALASYKHHGYCVVPELFTRQEIEQMTQFNLPQLKQMALHDPERRHLVQVVNLEGEDFTVKKIEKVSSILPDMRAYCNDERLLRIAGELMGEPACLFKDKYILKPKSGGGFGIHQDMTMGFHRFISGCISMMIALDPADEHNGCLQVASLSHCPALVSRPEAEMERFLIPEDAWQAVPLQPGDVAIFDGLTPHRSAPNTSDDLRRVYIVTYAPQADGDHYEDYYRWYFEWQNHIKSGGQRMDFRGIQQRPSRPQIKHFTDLTVARTGSY